MANFRSTASVAHPELLAAVEGHCSRFGIPISSFGEGAVNDPNLIRDLRNGREMRQKTQRKIEAYLAADRIAREEAEAATG